MLCQIHTHPGTAFHSAADDSGAYTDEIGFLSIVVPQFGVGGVAKAEIYRRDATGWIHEGQVGDQALVTIFDDRLSYDGTVWNAEV
jgi:hypothetical protein